MFGVDRDPVFAFEGPFDLREWAMHGRQCVVRRSAGRRDVQRLVAVPGQCWRVSLPRVGGHGGTGLGMSRDELSQRIGRCVVGDGQSCTAPSVGCDLDRTGDLHLPGRTASSLARARPSYEGLIDLDAAR